MNDVSGASTSSFIRFTTRSATYLSVVRRTVILAVITRSIVTTAHVYRNGWSPYYCDLAYSHARVLFCIQPEIELNILSFVNQYTHRLHHREDIPIKSVASISRARVQENTYFFASINRHLTAFPLT